MTLRDLDCSRARWLLLLLVVLGSGCLASALSQFDLWTAEEGLPQNVIQTVCQTGDGYLWVTTPNGIARFDGVRFTIFDKSTSPGIKSNRFTSGHVARGDDIWFGTDNGGVTRYHKGVFTTYTTAQGLPNNLVQAITSDEAGHVWVLAHHMIAAWQESLGQFVPIDKDDQKVYVQFSWEGDGFWALDRGRLYCFLRGRQRSYELPPWLQGPSVKALAEDKAGSIWIEANDGTQAKIVSDRIEKISSSHAEQKVWSYRDKNGNSLDFVIGRHLFRFAIFRTLSGDTYQAQFTSLFEDREGNVWLASDGQGLYRVRKQFITVYSKEQGLIDNNVYPIFQDHTGAIWIGAWQQGLSRFQNRELTGYSTEDGLPGGIITALAEDHEGALWIAGGTWVTKFSSNSFQRPPEIHFPYRASIQAIWQDRKEAFWFGTTEGLVHYQNGKSTLFTAREGLAGKDVRVIIEAAAGDLWFGGQDGVTRLQDGHFTRWTSRDGLPESTVRSIYAGRGGVIWIGTYDGGLVRLQNDKLTRFTTHEGLFNNGVFQILEDERGYFWMSCNRGIYRVSKRELDAFAAGTRTSVVSVHYGRADGLLNVECNGGLWPAGIKAQDGTLWFPTQGGVAVVDPSVVSSNPQPPPVVIESFLLDGSPRPLDRPLQVTPDKENLEIHYTALSFVRSEQMSFKYKLEGLESAWIDAGQRRTAYYSHVPPGEYLFHVIARNSDGIWNNNGQSLKVEVLAPFYRTWWFQSFAVLCVAALVGTAWHYRISQLQRAQAVQKAFSNQLIASQERERKRIAAELHDSLGQRLVVVKNLALFSLRANEGSQTRDWASTIQEISDEASLAIEETRQISYDLRPYHLDRLGLTKAIQAMIRKVSAASGIAILSQIDNIDDAFPEELRINLYRVIQECLNNIMRYAEATEANVSILRKGLCVLVTVGDNGRGFTPGAPNQETGRSGFGLTGMAERAHLLGGELNIQSRPNGGTTISLIVQCGGIPCD